MNLKKQKIPILLHHADNNLFCNQDKIVQKTVSIAKMSGIWKKKNNWFIYTKYNRQITVDTIYSYNEA